MRKIILIGAALVACFVAGGAVVAGLDARQDARDAGMIYESRQEALSAFQEELAGRALSDTEEQVRILGSFVDEWDVYYVLTEPQPYGGEEGPAIFTVAVVRKDGDKYGYFKATADVCLRPMGSEPPDGGVGYDYGEFPNVAGHRIGIGAIHDLGLVPYVDGQALPIGTGGAFATITDGAPTNIVIERP